MIPAPTVIRVAVRLMRVVPLPVMRGIGWLIGTLAWAVVAARRRVILENLSHLVPETSPAERRRLGRRTFRNLLDAAIDLFRLPSISRDDVLSLMHLEGEGEAHLESALALGRGLLIVTGHIGPYELGGAWMAARGFRVHAMVEDLDPETLEALALYRRATGMQLVSMKQGVRSVFRLLDEQAIVLLVADRAIGESKSAVDVPFANGVRPVPTGPATFAMAKGTPIIVGHIVRNPARRPRYVVHFDPPLLAQGRDEAERLRLTRIVTERIADAARRYPDQWYVFQPQWVGDGRDRR